MATYNGAKYLGEQINSILQQTISDFELIICDDCSTDDTWEILNKYAKSDKRIKLYKNNENLGFKSNFEKAISLTTQEYVALCDQDDIWENNHLELLLKNLGDKNMACGNSLLVDAHNHSMGMELSYQEALDYVPEDDLKKAYTIFYFRCPFQGASMLMKRDFLKIALPIPKECNYHDVWFSGLSCFCGGFNYLKTPITRYRQHGTNVSGRRITRRSKIKYWLRHIMRSHYVENRKYIATHILKRVNNLNTEEKEFLLRVISNGERKKTLIGRLRNSLFELKHYKLIYCCQGRFWY